MFTTRSTSTLSSQSEACGRKLMHLSILDGYNVMAGGLTANAIDHERVQLLLAMFALAREVWHGLDLPMEQVVQQRQSHFLCGAAVCGDMEHVSWRHWATNSHLWVVLISQPGALWVIIYSKEENNSNPVTWLSFIKHVKITEIWGSM